MKIVDKILMLFMALVVVFAVYVIVDLIRDAMKPIVYTPLQKRLNHSHATFNFDKERWIVTEENENGEVVNRWEVQMKKAYP